jgi:cell division protein FtsI (penicillin-binding protein 3)
MKPYLVERITDERGKVVAEFSPVVRRQILTKEVCRRVSSVLKEVVKSGTGSRAQIAGYDVAGKTGTAQKVIPDTGAYSKDKIVASFMGYLPADDPQVAIIVVVDEPKNNPYGGTTASPVFKRIAEELIRYIGISPKSDDVGKKTTLVKLPAPAKDKKRQTKGPSPQGMPDLRGLSMRKALTLLEGERVRVRIAGSGTVIGQQPNPGSSLKEGSEVSITLTAGR